MTDWKDDMFVEKAGRFEAILEAKGIPADFAPFIGSLGEAGQFARVLDLGCGTGRLFEALAPHAQVVIGIDYSEQLLKAAGRRARAAGNVVALKCDMRRAGELFPPETFDLIVRAYTSLGYFGFDEEVALLQSLADIAAERGRLVVDTFNASWISEAAAVTRTAELPTFTFEERYAWNEAEHSIDSTWTYRSSNGLAETIPFSLDGYDVDRIDDLLHRAGWQRERLYFDYAPAARLERDVGAERLVIVAVKA